MLRNLLGGPDPKFEKNYYRILFTWKIGVNYCWGLLDIDSTSKWKWNALRPIWYLIGKRRQHFSPTPSERQAKMAANLPWSWWQWWQGTMKNQAYKRVPGKHSSIYQPGAMGQELLLLTPRPLTPHNICHLRDPPQAMPTNYANIPLCVSFPPWTKNLSSSLGLILVCIQD